MFFSQQTYINGMNRISKYLVMSILVLIGTNVVSLLVYRNKLEDAERSVLVYKDSVHDFRDSRGELWKRIDLIEMNKKSLEETNKGLLKEIEQLKKVLHITKTKVQTKIDTLVITRDISKTDKWEYEKKFDDDNLFSMRMGVREDTLTMESLLMRASLIQVIEEKDGYLRTLVRTENPLLEITDVRGALYDIRKSNYIKGLHKPKRWGLSFVSGIGVGYDGKFVASPFVGVGISYDIVSW